MSEWLACELELEDGRIARFGPDEADAGDLPSEIAFQTQNPGGFGDASITIHRPEWATREALLFSPARIYGPGGRTFYEGRCKDVSQADPTSIRLDFEGWAAHLDDDQSFRQLYVSRDLTKWSESSRTHRLALLGVFSHYTGPTVESDTTNGIPSVALSLESGLNPASTGVFDAGPGQTISSIYYDFTSRSTSGYNGQIGTMSDDIATASDLSADLLTGTNSSGSGTHTPTAAYRYGYLVTYVVGTPTAESGMTWRRLAVFGDHGLAKSGAAPDEGYTGTQILAHAVSTGAPMLTADTESIEISSYVFTHLDHESGTVRELVERINAHGGAANEVNDWGVYEDRKFFWKTPGTHGRTWRVRRDQFANPTEDGPAAEGRFAGVLVGYQDAAGTTKTVGPPQSGADYETAVLTDQNDSNPARRVPNRIVRRDVGITTREGAVLLGQALLAEQNANVRRGSVSLTGQVLDEGGALHPAAAVRACDRVVIEDEAGTQPETQYINQTNYDHNSLTVTANLGTTPHKVDLVLARLAAAVEGI